METCVEIDTCNNGSPAGICVRMLGPLGISRNEVALDLPASRKVRGLFAFLALAPRAVGRSRLCELLWDVPNDPRGELRWCLSKLRNMIDEPDRKRIVSSGDLIALDLSGCSVDAIDIDNAITQRIETIDLEKLRALSRLFVGDFLEGLAISRSPHFEGWLNAQRRRFRFCHIAVMEHLIKSLPAGCDEAFLHLEKWVELAPCDARAHLALLGALAARGKIADCEEHLTATSRLFDAEDLDFGRVREGWQIVKERRTSMPSVAIGVTASPSVETDPSSDSNTEPRRASLAVMPFVEQANINGVRGGLAGGLTHDIITRLAKLRDLFVIARGSVFALAERNIGPEDAGRTLNVDYVASGAIRHERGRIDLVVELIDARTARIVWAETFDHKYGDAFIVLDEICNRIVSSIANEIETVERNRAILKPPNSLDAWEAYHRGLWHMYRFTKPENQLAQHFFEMAVRLDPTFARAYAGLSFTHWQNAFQHWADREHETSHAFETAGQSLIADDHNPAAHWAMGRALWLGGREDESTTELKTAVELSPNFALGHYALSFVQSQSGDAKAAICSSDHSRQLSPFDPLLFGMLGTRAIAHVRLGEYEDAAEWALKAAARPNAHANILAIAAHCLALAGRTEEGQAITNIIHRSLPHYRSDDFLTTFRFTPDTSSLFRRIAPKIGLG